MRSILMILAVLFAVSCIPALPASAQTTTADQVLVADTAQAETAQIVPDQKPPAAVAEEGKKPTRGFASALVHNLGDDLKHLPRRNSVYWPLETARISCCGFCHSIRTDASRPLEGRYNTHPL